MQEDGSVGSDYNARVTPWIWLRMPNAVGGEPTHANAFFELKEGWVQRTSPGWDLRIGNQIFAWGAADQINPTDVWNPRDYYDPFMSPKLPIAAADLRIHPPQIENVNLEVIFTPFFRSSPMPVAIPDSGTLNVSATDSRWLLPIPTELSAAGVLTPLQYQITSATYPETWQAGARLQVTRIGGWDFSTSFYDGVESLPRFAVIGSGSASNPSLPITLTLSPSFYREQMYGLDGTGSVSFGDTVIGTRFEVAYYNRDNSRVYQAPAQFQSDLFRDNYVFGVAGADYTFQHEILGTILYVNSMFVHFQQFGSYTGVPTVGTTISGLPSVWPFDDNPVLYWENRFSPKLKFTGEIVASFDESDYYVVPSIQYKPSDDLTLALGGEMFFGDASAFFGQFNENSRVVFSGTYVF